MVFVNKVNCFLLTTKAFYLLRYARHLCFACHYASLSLSFAVIYASHVISLRLSFCASRVILR